MPETQPADSTKAKKTSNAPDDAKHQRPDDCTDSVVDQNDLHQRGSQCNCEPDEDFTLYPGAPDPEGVSEDDFYLSLFPEDSDGDPAGSEQEPPSTQVSS